MAWQWKPAKFIWLYKRPMLTDFNHNNGASSRWKALRNKFNLSGNFLSHCDVHVNIDVTMETEVKQLCFSKFALSLKNRFYCLFLLIVSLYYTFSIINILLVTFYWQLGCTSLRRIAKKMECAGFDSWNSFLYFYFFCFLFFLYSFLSLFLLLLL